MSLAKQLVVRYRAAGHVRFTLPKPLCQPQPAQQLEEALQRVEGVYRVDLYGRQGKLSIRYSEGLADIKSVASALHDIVSRIEIPPAEPTGYARYGLVRGKTRPGIAGWLEGKYQEAADTLSALRLVPHKGPGPRPVLTPERRQFAVDFLTDILVLYLIKLHWGMIFNSWLRRPWQFRYEWMATFYLIFLLVRSRKPK